MKPTYNINEIMKLINLSTSVNDLTKINEIVIEEKKRYPLVELRYITEQLRIKNNELSKI